MEKIRSFTSEEYLLSLQASESAPSIGERARGARDRDRERERETEREREREGERETDQSPSEAFIPKHNGHLK